MIHGSGYLIVNNIEIFFLLIKIAAAFKKASGLEYSRNFSIINRVLKILQYCELNTKAIVFVIIYYNIFLYSTTFTETIMIVVWFLSGMKQFFSLLKRRKSEVTLIRLISTFIL